MCLSTSGQISNCSPVFLSTEKKNKLLSENLNSHIWCTSKLSAHCLGLLDDGGSLLHPNVFYCTVLHTIISIYLRLLALYVCWSNLNGARVWTPGLCSVDGAECWPVPCCKLTDPGESTQRDRKWGRERLAFCRPLDSNQSAELWQMSGSALSVCILCTPNTKNMAMLSASHNRREYSWCT